MWITSIVDTADMKITTAGPRAFDVTLHQDKAKLQEHVYRALGPHRPDIPWKQWNRQGLGKVLIHTKTLPGGMIHTINEEGLLPGSRVIQVVQQNGGETAVNETKLDPKSLERLEKAGMAIQELRYEAENGRWIPVANWLNKLFDAVGFDEPVIEVNGHDYAQHVREYHGFLDRATHELEEDNGGPLLYICPFSGADLVLKYLKPAQTVLLNDDPGDFSRGMYVIGKTFGMEGNPRFAEMKASMPGPLDAKDLKNYEWLATKSMNNVLVLKGAYMYSEYGGNFNDILPSLLSKMRYVLILNREDLRLLESTLIRHGFDPGPRRESQAMWFFHLIGGSGARKPDTVLLMPDAVAIFKKRGP